MFRPITIAFEVSIAALLFFAFQIGKEFGSGQSNQEGLVMLFFGLVLSGTAFVLTLNHILKLARDGEY